MNSSHPPVADSQYVQSSQKMWDKFIKAAFAAAVLAVVLLLVLAATLL